ncbi:MAG: two pore domain potassium channel family protein [Solirubrobacteraceae bacterium]|nr:two pore domain potassium channel family protein [Solirubrobacteraceae bacterium]
MNEDRAARWKSAFEWPTIAAAILVIPALALEQSAAEPWNDVASALNWVIWLVFAAELVAMLAVSERRGRYLREHPLDVAIVLLTPPFLPAALQAARVLRLLRLLRLVKTAVIVRRLLSAEGIRDAAVLAVSVVLGGGAAFASVERAQHLSTWDGIWWAMTTVTTVGYGDISPETTAGRVIAMTVMTVGIGFVALVTAAAAERFIKGPSQDTAVADQLAALDERLGRLEQLLRERH